MYLVQPPKKKSYYDFWEVLGFFGIEKYGPYHGEFMVWVLDCQVVQAVKSREVMLVFNEAHKDPFILDGSHGFQINIVNQAMTKALAHFGEPEVDGGPNILRLQFRY